MKILSSTEISVAGELLRKGGVVAFPTETVYGLGAPIFSQKAISKVFFAKNRPSDNPLIAHISSIEQVGLIAVDIPEEFYRLADAFWPGPLSILLHASEKVPLIARAGLPTIAVRMPKHAIAQALIDEVGEPLVAPSANLSGKPSSTCVEHVVQDFHGKISAVLDGGPCEHGLESTVIALHFEEGPTILRPGAISRADLAKVLGKPILQTKREEILSPGMKYRHYAPKAVIKLFFDQNSVDDYSRQAHPLRRRLLSRQDGTLSGKDFYAALRRADFDGIEEIIIICDEEIRSNEALMNRILKASGIH